MTGLRDVDESDIEALGERIDLEFAAGDAAAAADRVNTLAGIYRDLEALPADWPGGPAGVAEEFTQRPHAPAPGDDPHNAWLSRFELVRPDREGPLSGLDVAIKDNTCVAGVEMTMGSRAFEGFAPADHAAVVERFLDAGGRIVGKTNMDELAFGPTSETSAFGPTENPAAAGHVAGGSSSGSAAAVAAGDVDLALGTDTGGSVRIPASYCGVVGIKPTFGTVPLHGVAELAYSMDHVGTLARDVETAARGLDAIAGPVHDAPLHRELGTDLDGLRVGVPGGLFAEHVSAGVEGTVRDALDAIAAAGGTLVDVEIPALEHSRAAWWGIAPAEFAAAYRSNATGLWRRGRAVESLAAGTGRVRRADSRRLGSGVKEMLALGAYLLSEYDGRHYVRARNLRETLREGVDAALEGVDVLAAPATPTTALEVGGFERGVTPPVNWDTHPTNLTGHPSVSLPCGESDGRPVGLQLVGPWSADGLVLDVARAYERDVARAGSDPA